jgi:hypothetical protein
MVAVTPERKILVRGIILEWILKEQDVMYWIWCGLDVMAWTARLDVMWTKYDGVDRM